MSLFSPKANLALGRVQDAIADLSIAIAYCPNLAEAYTERATAYDALGDKKAASADREKAKSVLLNQS